MRRAAPAGVRIRYSLLAVSSIAVLGGGSSRPETRGLREFTDARNPPAYANLDASEQERVDLGHAVFNTQWVPAGTANAARHDGLGPLYNASSCDACHNEGAHGRGPSGDGAAPVALVIQLEKRPLETRAQRRGQNMAGDPRYGHTLNTAAIDGFSAEGRITIHYQELSGIYPDGAMWHLRAPHYRLTELTRGPLELRTVIQPRLAPALFGVGLLEARIATPRAASFPLAGAPRPSGEWPIDSNSSASPRSCMTVARVRSRKRSYGMMARQNRRGAGLLV